MKTIRIWFDRGYFGDLNDNVVTWILRKKYNVILDSINPDILICDNNNADKYDSNKCIKIYYSGEPYYPSLSYFNEGHYHYGFSSFYINDMGDNHFRFPQYLWTSYQYIKDGDINSFDYFFKKREYNKDILKIKNKFCCFIQGGPIDGNGQYRDTFYKKMVDLKYKHIDCPGTRYNNMPRLLGDSSNSPFQSKMKREFIKPYKFIISFESVSIVNGYDGLTDLKVFDCFPSNTLPIYWGNRLIHKDVNTKAIINCHEYINIEKIFDKIIEIDNNDTMYIDYMIEPPVYNNCLLDTDYLLNIFEKIINK
jgi:hypothetical protein